MLPRMRIELGKGRRAIRGRITFFMETLNFFARDKHNICWHCFAGIMGGVVMPEHNRVKYKVVNVYIIFF